MTKNARDEALLRRTHQLAARTEGLMTEIEDLLEGHSLPEILFALGTLAAVQGITSAPRAVSQEEMWRQSLAADQTVERVLVEAREVGWDHARIINYFGDCLVMLALRLPVVRGH